MEVLTFGKLARLFKGLDNNNEKTEIAQDFNVPSPLLASWFVYLNNVRNVCAHQARLWNRRITADRWKVPNRQKYQFNGTIPADFNTTFYGVTAMIDRLLFSFNPNNSFILRLQALIDQYSHTIHTIYMGFPEDWKENPAWLRTN